MIPELINDSYYVYFQNLLLIHDVKQLSVNIYLHDIANIHLSVILIFFLHNHQYYCFNIIT